MTHFKVVWCLVALSIIAAPSAFADVVEKPPDLGAFWQPLDPDSGTYIYADSFVALTSGQVSSLGTWLLALEGAGTGGLVAFEIYDSIGGNLANGPDSTNVIASTGLLNIGGGTATLDLYEANALFSAALVEGQTYWFGANVIGGGPGGAYQAGGHTQNSVYNDNGTFWFSNDSTGIFFDGQNNVPEIPFRVTIVPEPTGAIIGLGLVALAWFRRRRP